MAINTSLILAGIGLLKLVIEKIWKAEEKEICPGTEKHKYVRNYVDEFLEKHELEVEEIDSIISDLVAILNKYKIFKKRG